MSPNDLEKKVEEHKLNVKLEKAAHREAERRLEEKSLEVSRANKTLKQLTEELQSEVERKNHELLIAYNEALDASKAQTQFIATISHEMRTPLNAILGFTELIKKNLLSSNVDRYVKNIDTAAQSLLQLIDNVLDLSKVETGNIEIESNPFDIYDFLERIRSTYAVLAQKKGIHLTLYIDPSAPTFLVGDEHRLSQVLVNIISNAIKFTNEGQISIGCHAESVSKTSAAIRFSINDTGIGITKEQISHIFDPFRQADGSITRKYGGTGLGLSICNRLVKLMGGTIRVESQLEFGSCFSFMVNLSIDHERTGSIDTKHSPGIENLKGKHALVVEDNNLNTEMIVDLLELSHIKVTAVENGLEALNWYNAGNRCDFILMDMQMPVMDGLEATRKLKALEGFNIPIVAMTANTAQSALQQCLQSGMVAFLTKPICFDNLAKTLVKVLEKPEDIHRKSSDLQKNKRTFPIHTDKPVTQETLDINHALSLLAGNLKIYKKIVHQFINGYEEGIYSIKNLIEQRDHGSVVRLIHTMKSVADNLGALSLADFCKNLDRSISQTDIEPAVQAASEYQDLLNESANALTKWLAGNA